MVSEFLVERIETQMIGTFRQEASLKIQENIKTEEASLKIQEKLPLVKLCESSSLSSASSKLLSFSLSFSLISSSSSISVASTGFYNIIIIIRILARK